MAYLCINGWGKECDGCMICEDCLSIIEGCG
jgi:hypothetical protein